jgi:hypothetical protein
MSHTKTACAPDDQMGSVRATPAMANVSRPVRTCNPESHQRGKRGPTPEANYGRHRWPPSTDVAIGPAVDLWVPITSSTSCDQPIFVDHATDLSLFSDAVQVEVDRLG